MDQQISKEKMSYPLLNLKTHFSLLQSTIQPKKLAAVLKEKGVTACAITDIGVLCGTVQFYKEMKNAGIKPILGCTFNIVIGDSLEYLILLAKNKTGWKQLLKLNSIAHSQERFTKIPVISPEDLKTLDTSTLFAISDNHISLYQSIFGDTFRVGVKGFTQNVEKLRKYVKEKNLKAIAFPDPHYANPQDADDLLICLATKFKTVLSNLKNRVEQFDPRILPLLESNLFYIPDAEKLKKYFTPEELRETAMLASEIEEYDILSPPQLPHFECPAETTPIGYLKSLCLEGELKKGIKDKPNYSTYKTRLEYEIKILEEANLANYFLIVRDIILYAQSKQILVGYGRGSAAGCLVSYLIDITSVDPIKYNLVFERFFNSARIGSLPDIDTDFPVTKRGEIIDYIRTKYGENKVGNMITFQTLKGRSALKDVLRAQGSFSFDEINRITEHIEDEAKIADELAEIKEEEGEASIIYWALQNKPKEFKEWAFIENDKIVGPLARQFEQAIRLEGVKSASSKHPSGIIIAAEELENYPLYYDSKSKQPIVGVEMEECEALGLVKMDVLGIAALDKVMKICKEIGENYVIQ